MIRYGRVGVEETSVTLRGGGLAGKGGGSGVLRLRSHRESGRREKGTRGLTVFLLPAVAGGGARATLNRSPHLHANWPVHSVGVGR